MIDYIQKEFIDNGKIKDSNYIIGIDMVFRLRIYKANKYCVDYQDY